MSSALSTQLLTSVTGHKSVDQEPNRMLRIDAIEKAIYIYIYIYIYVYIYIYIYIYVSIYLSISLSLSLYIYIYIDICIYDIC